MKKVFFLIFAFMIFTSHDMFLKLDGYFLSPNSPASIKLFNGTFDNSENVIARDRMMDVSLLKNGERIKLDTTHWMEKDSATILNFETGAEGTYVVGVSTKARNIDLDAEAFNSYLEHDGVLDMIEWRKANDAMEEDAVEKYSKHVKTIFQVGNKKTEDWGTVLGYPIEFVPKSNPYDLYTGDQIEVQLLSNGKPLADQLVYVGSQAPLNGHSHGTAEAHSHDEESHEHSHDDGETHSHDEESHEHSHDDGETHSHDEESHEHSHDGGETHSHDEDSHEHSHSDGETHSHDEDSHEHSHDGGESHSHDDEANSSDEDGHTHTSGGQLRTNDEGIVTVNLKSDGIWYLRTINLELSEEEGLTHESNWATLTFEVGHSHEDIAESHVHEDESPFGIPSYAYWLGSFAIIGILFFWFYRKA